MILSFKKRFVSLINEGSKIHTIREDKHSRWHKGRKIHFATGVRTKNYNCFKEGVCKSVQKIEIKWILNKYKHPHKTACVIIDDTILDRFDVEDLARNDGFENIYDFFNWFDKNFIGKIIHWSQLKY